MKKIQVCLIDNDFAYRKQTIIGYELGDMLKNTLKKVSVFNYGDKIKDSAEIIADIPVSMVLVDDVLLDELAEKVKKEGAVRFGDAIMYKKEIGKENAKVLPHRVEFTSADSPEDLAVIFAHLKERINKYHQNNGVIILEPATTYIDFQVQIAAGVVIHPSVKLIGNTVLSEGVIIYSFTELVDTEVGHDTDIRSSFLTGTKIGSHTTVGPFACTRVGTVIGSNCRIGDYVEIKNSNLGNGVKVAHLAYIGDSNVGDRCNVGCGTVFANYDGQKKSRCTIGQEVFIGANTNLVAPVTVGDNAFIAAGSTITDDVPPHAMSIARERQVIKPNWRRPS